MWKPGTERPKKGRKLKGDDKDDVGGGGGGGLANSDKSPPAVKKLSSGTMNMRFMQRTTVSPKQLQTTSGEKSHETPVDMQIDDTTNGVASNDEDVKDQPTTTSRFVTATGQDMYGSVLVGRRSLGGFRPVVEQMHQQAVASISKDEGNRKRKRGKKKENS